MSDPVVAHSDRWSVPADGDAGGGRVEHFKVCGSIRDWREKSRGQNNKQPDDDIVSNWRASCIKSAFRTRLLFPTERQALFRAAHCVDADQVLCVWSQSCQGEVVPGWGQPLVLGPPAADHLVADTVTGDFALGSQPVDGKGVGEDLRETQRNW